MFQPEEISRRWFELRVARTAERHPKPLPFPGALLTVNPSDESPYPSANQNRIEYSAHIDWSEALVNLTLDPWLRAGVKQGFAFVPCGPTQTILLHYLQSLGAKPYTGTQYLVLAQTLENVDETEDKSVVDARTVPSTVIPTWSPDSTLAACLNSPGYELFSALEQERPIGHGLLIESCRTAYLGHGFVHPDFRERHWHRKLIQARLSRAKQLGCNLAISETLAFLERSWANLLACGFEVSFEHIVLDLSGPLIRLRANREG
jgi:GNAT superfamily N-acetyltransferase